MMGKLLSFVGALAALAAAALVSADAAPAYAQRVKPYGECRRVVMADPRFMRRPGGACDRVCAGAIRRCMAGQA
jgi:hypothetical protein